jgi:RNA polymerase sigma-70 factor (ECF subfamily)
MAAQPLTRHSLLLRLHDAADEAAWGQFTELYEPVIYRLARARGLQDADAREVVQEVLMAVAKAAERLPPHVHGEAGGFRRWLAITTRNRVIDRFRRREVRGTGRSTQVQRLAELPAAAEPGTELQQELRKQLFSQAADHVKQQVASSTWQAFWLTAVENQPVARVAQQLDISVGNVYVARCRVLDRIRNWVQEQSRWCDTND